MASTPREHAAIRDQSLEEYPSSCDEQAGKAIKWVRNPHDGSILHDHRGRPISVDRMLATKPLRHELCTRPGPGGRHLTYMGGDAVTRTLNEVFGYDGWTLTVKSTEMSNCEQLQGKWSILYTSHVRITVGKTFREELGQGDASDRCKATAASNAMKASVTDAIKRAARLFGDKLGNTLYGSGFSKKDAPLNLASALDLYDKERAERLHLGPSPETNPINQPHNQHQNDYMIKQEPGVSANAARGRPLYQQNAQSVPATNSTHSAPPPPRVASSAPSVAYHRGYSVSSTNSTTPLRTSSVAVNQMPAAPQQLVTSYAAKRPYSNMDPSMSGSLSKKSTGGGINPYASK